MRERPGVFQRTKEWWEVRTLRMPEAENGAAEQLRGFGFGKSRIFSEHL